MESDPNWQALLRGRPIDRRLSYHELNQLHHHIVSRRANRLVDFMQRHAGERPAIQDFLKTISNLDRIAQAARLREWVGQPEITARTGQLPDIRSLIMDIDLAQDDSDTLPSEVISLNSLLWQRDVSTAIHRLQTILNDALKSHIKRKMVSFAVNKGDMVLFHELIRYPEFRDLNLVQFKEEPAFDGLSGGDEEWERARMALLRACADAFPTTTFVFLHILVLNYFHVRDWKSLRGLLTHPRIAEISNAAEYLEFSPERDAAIPFRGRDEVVTMVTSLRNEMPHDLFLKFSQLLDLHSLDDLQAEN